MNDFLQWHADFELGHDKIDQHHRHTFALANQLHAAAKAKNQPSAISIIEAYLKHLQAHCGYEEDLLRKSRRLQELEKLSQAHKVLIEKATAAYHQVANGQMQPDQFFYDIIVITDIAHHQTEDDLVFRKST
jgi:hemerythrin-like metal-binding protein